MSQLKENNTSKGKFARDGMNSFDHLRVQEVLFYELLLTFLCLALENNNFHIFFIIKKEPCKEAL